MPFTSDQEATITQALAQKIQTSVPLAADSMPESFFQSWCSFRCIPYLHKSRTSFHSLQRAIAAWPRLNHRTFCARRPQCRRRQRLMRRHQPPYQALRLFVAIAVSWNSIMPTC